MTEKRVFVSHSSEDSQFANLVVKSLRSPDLKPWIDSDQIIAGEDILERLGQGLQTMDVLVFLISETALESRWIDLEVKGAVQREIEEKRAMVLPFIIDGTSRTRLPWFLRHRNVPRITPDEAGAEQIVRTVKRTIERRSKNATNSLQDSGFKREPRIDKMLPRTVDDWKTAQNAALNILNSTSEAGENELFTNLLRYLDCPDEDLRFRAVMIIESFAELAPYLIDRKLLIRMASHTDFMIRSSAAVICFDLAQFTPERVPIEVLVRLAAYDEDWYVKTPATAALQTMARSRPALLSVFYSGLRSLDEDARENASRAIAEIAEREPEILEREELERELSKLRAMQDERAVDNIVNAISRIENSNTANRYKYWPF
jgi:hypothetical protein